ncbi:MAG: peptide-methionine (S)-S-oxide reductase MsrA [Patescibacteria group bacterium]
MAQLDTATFGAGCFWCTEAVFEALEGVVSATSGYAGGDMEKPTYEAVCAGNTGHAEAVQVAYDPDKVSYADLLEVFWATHDPTTQNRQGADIGVQYRSVIFYHDEEQKRLAEASKEILAASGEFTNPIVTEIVPFRAFFPAERRHQEYYKNNQDAPYCQIVITPKFEKFAKRFKEKLKK